MSVSSIKSAQFVTCIWIVVPHRHRKWPVFRWRSPVPRSSMSKVETSLRRLRHPAAHAEIPDASAKWWLVQTTRRCPARLHAEANRRTARPVVPDVGGPSRFRPKAVDHNHISAYKLFASAVCDMNSAAAAAVCGLWRYTGVIYLCQCQCLNLCFNSVQEKCKFAVKEKKQ